LFLSLAYLALRCLLQIVLLRLRSEGFKELEIVVLRHEFSVLRCQADRPQLRPSDRLVLAAASRLLPRSSWGLFLVTPSTLLRWHWFPPELRRVVYTTNAIEALNRQLRKAIKTKGHFPNEEAARKLIYLAITNAVPAWTRTRNWTKALLASKIHFGDLLPE